MSRAKADAIESRYPTARDLLRKLARRFPTLLRAYKQSGHLAHVLCTRLFRNPRQMMDHAHRVHEWDFDGAIEQERHRRTITAIRQQIGSQPWGDCLELGCSEGSFTLRLASLCRSVTAWDISSVACFHAAERCKSFPNVRVFQADCINRRSSGQYDMVVVMDVLDMLYGRRRVETVAQNAFVATRRGGLLVFSGSRLPSEIARTWWARRLLLSADDQIEYLQGCGLKLLHREQYPYPGQSLPDYPDHLIALLSKE